jgi:hypothetical protein
MQEQRVYADSRRTQTREGVTFYQDKPSGAHISKGKFQSLGHSPNDHQQASSEQELIDSYLEKFDEVEPTLPIYNSGPQYRTDQSNYRTDQSNYIMVKKQTPEKHYLKKNPMGIQKNLDMQGGYSTLQASKENFEIIRHSQESDLLFSSRDFTTNPKSPPTKGGRKLKYRCTKNSQTIHGGAQPIQSVISGTRKHLDTPAQFYPSNTSADKMSAARNQRKASANKSQEKNWYDGIQKTYEVVEKNLRGAKSRQLTVNKAREDDDRLNERFLYEKIKEYKLGGMGGRREEITGIISGRSGEGSTVVRDNLERMKNELPGMGDEKFEVVVGLFESFLQVKFFDKQC